MQNRTTHLARIIAAASVAFAIFTGLAACQEPGATDVTVGAADEELAAAASTTTTAVSETTLEDTSADDGGGLPADGALLAAAQQQANPSAFTTRDALDAQAQAAAEAEAAAQEATTTTEAPTTTAAPVVETTTTTAPAPPPAPVAAPAPAPTGGMTAAEASFLACVRQRESGGNYSVVSANGLYYGAYQFHRSTWDTTANHAGRYDLVGVAPNIASPADQDAMALHLYRWQGPAPWGGYC